jgi:hypothetical protein
MITIIYESPDHGQLTFRVDPIKNYQVTLDRSGFKTAHIGTENSLERALVKIGEYTSQEMANPEWATICQQILILIEQRSEKYFEIEWVTKPMLSKHH